MRVVDNVLGLVGQTPMLKLRIDGHLIYAKAEFLNPSGSVKDRIAKYIIEEAERRGELRPGCTIVEATSGNTGIAFSCAAAAKGYKMVVVMPETASVERRTIMKHYDAEVVLTPAKDFIEGAVKKAKELGSSPGYWMPAQFENRDNVAAHESTTGREILSQVPNGHVDAFVAGIGTGGTLMGVAKVLRARNPDVRVVAVDPCGEFEAGTIEHFTCTCHKVEGIGDGFIPAIMDLNLVDQVVAVPDRDALSTAKWLAKTHGLFVGTSSGAYVHVALGIAKELGDNKVVVTLLPDSADRYYSTDLFRE